MKICRGDVEDVLEALGVLGEEFWKRGLKATKNEFQVEECPAWDGEVVQEG